METVNADTPLHPVIAILPPMGGRERAQLKSSIERDGVHNPITVHDGTIIDGGLRRDAASATGRACAARGLPEGNDPVEYALTQNLTRRQLTPGQRAMVIAEVAQWNERENNNHPRYRLEALAERYGVAKSSANQAVRVAQSCIAEIGEAAKKGEIGLADAASGHGESEAHQHEALKQVRAGASRTLATALYAIPVAKTRSRARTLSTSRNEGWRTKLRDWLRWMGEWSMGPRSKFGACVYIEIRGYKSAEAVQAGKADAVEILQRS